MFKLYLGPRLALGAPGYSPLSGHAKWGFRGYIVPGPAPRGAWAQGAQKSSDFRVKFWYRTITP